MARTNSSDRIILITDCVDVAIVEMRLAVERAYLDSGGLGSVLPRFEPVVACDSFSITNASFLTRLLAELALPGALLMVIANPMKERPARILGRTLSGVYFEGPNTGAFGWLVSEKGVETCIEISDPGFVPFGGKHVHAPAVGRLLAGVPLDRLGSPFPHDAILGGIPKAFEIVHIDNFGNAKLFAASKDIETPLGEKRLRIVTSRGVTFEAHVGSRMMEFPDGHWVIYPGSSMGLLELGQVRGRGLLEYQVRVGEVLTVEGPDH